MSETATQPTTYSISHEQLVRLLVIVDRANALAQELEKIEHAASHIIGEVILRDVDLENTAQIGERWGSIIDAAEAQRAAPDA